MTIGALGVDFSANSDLDIFSPNLAYATHNNTLYSINLTTSVVIVEVYELP